MRKIFLYKVYTNLAYVPLTYRRIKKYNFSQSIKTYVNTQQVKREMRSHLEQERLPYPLHHPLPPPPPPPPAPYHLLGIPPHVPTISNQPRPPASVPSSHRGPESDASQCISKLCSASLICKPLSPQIPPPPSMLLAVSITTPPPPISSAVSLLYTG